MKTEHINGMKGLASNEKSIISQIKEFINIKKLEPEEKLHSEQLLAERYGGTCLSIRSTIQILKNYGLLKPTSQSEVFVADFERSTLNEIIDPILSLLTLDFKSLFETHNFLEHKIVKLTAARCIEKASDKALRNRILLSNTP